jgi:hypothetical protein
VSSLALFVALGGSAFAVTQIDANSVGTKQLKANAVKSGKIADGTIKRRDVRQGAFATPAQLVGINAATLGGIGPNGFVRGTRLTTAFDVTEDTDVLTIPGGGKIAVDCAPNGYFVFFLATTTTWDLFEHDSIDNVNGQDVRHDERTTNEGIVFSATKEESVFHFDAKSAAGPAADVTVWTRFDDATDHCIGRVRGVSLPS